MSLNWNSFLGSNSLRSECLQLPDDLSQWEKGPAAAWQTPQTKPPPPPTCQLSEFISEEGSKVAADVHLRPLVDDTTVAEEDKWS